jgi:hypothetical protein
VAEEGDESSKGSEAAMKVDPLWMEALEMIDGDLHWLLQQTHHKFWCQVRENEVCIRRCEINMLVHVHVHVGDVRHFITQVFGFLSLLSTKVYDFQCTKQ